MCYYLQIVYLRKKIVLVESFEFLYFPDQINSENLKLFFKNVDDYIRIECGTKQYEFFLIQLIIMYIV